MRLEEQVTSEEDKKPLTYTEFMQVGAMIACGHCNPDKYVLTDPCTCNCHYAMSEEVKEKWEGEFDAKYKEHKIVGDRTFEDYIPYTYQSIKDFIRTQRSLAQQEILDRVEETMDKYVEDWYDKYKGCGMADAQQAIKEMKVSVLSTLKDTNI